MLKKSIIAMSIIAVLLTGAAAEEQGDHALIGRYQNSSLRFQEISRFEEYEFTTGVDSVETITGEVWMTRYDGPDGSSTFSIYATYLDYLESMGFEIILSYKPGEAPPDFAEIVYMRDPFADNDNYSNPAPFTNCSDGETAFIAAQGIVDGVPTYVSIIIAAGWASFPQYKVDVIEVAENKAGIQSSGTTTPRTAVDSESTAVSGDTAGAADDTGGTSGGDAGTLGSLAGVLSNISVFSYGGYCGYQLLDPQIAGGFQSGGDPATPTVDASGWKNLIGPHVGAGMYFGDNFGVSVEYSNLKGKEDLTLNNIYYENSIEMNLVRLALIGRIQGDQVPVALLMTFGGGLANVYASRLVDDGSAVQVEGDDFFGMVTFSTRLNIPLFAGVFLEGGVEYIFIPFSDFTMTDSAATELYNYYESNFGGLKMILGAGVAF